MIAQSAVSASASGATVCVSSPSADPTVGRDPEERRVQELPDRADRHRGEDEGREEHDTEERPAAPHVGDQDGQEQSEPGLEHDRGAGEQDRVQQAPMEHGVAEDRPRVVLEADERREVEALRVVDAEHDAVDERVDEEAGQDHQDRQQEQQVDGAFAARAADANASGHPGSITAERGTWTPAERSPGPRRAWRAGDRRLAPSRSPTSPAAGSVTRRRHADEHAR